MELDGKTGKGLESMEEENDKLLVEIENNNVTNNAYIGENDKFRGDSVSVPEVGMMFDGEKEAFEFYKKYAYEVGFPVRKRNSKKGHDGVVRYATFTCSREGRRSYGTSNSLKQQPTSQTDCKARISTSLLSNGKGRVNTTYLEHNHKTSPSKSRLYRCNRELIANVKRKLEVNDMVGIPLHKTYNSAVVEACGYDSITFIEKDCRNYIEQVRRLRLGDGDAAAIQAYFATMQARCSEFYFSMDLDEESRLKNVFWVDNRCRQAYKEFGDVVTFDTTYLTNKYNTSFAPFFGVNHHGQSILLGCGLITSEETVTFVWLFWTWLQCMHGQASKGIITYQNRTIQNAIQIVFPHTTHRWCLWRILKKFTGKFGYHVDKASIFSTIHGLVYDSQTVEEFEEGWRGMIDRYNLYDSDWLSGLFESRCRWVPCFLKTTFWAEMLTTQRSESINAFFDGYVHSKTSLKQFLEQYERALRSKVEKEFQADFKSYAQMVPCATKYDMETQFQKVYTISKFREVQDELIGKVYCDIISVSKGCSGMIYKVLEDVLLYGAHRTKRTFSVSFTRKTCDIVCSCHLFEFQGIDCRHAVTVLIRNDVKFLPDKFILRRWRRDVSRAHTRVAVYYDGLVGSPAQLRYDDMCWAFSEVADLAANDEERSSIVMDWIKLQAKELKLSCGSHPSHVISCGTDSQNCFDVNVLDPVSLKRKGVPRKLRRKGPLELTSKKVKATSTSTKGKKPTGRLVLRKKLYQMLTPLNSFHP